VIHELTKHNEARSQASSRWPHRQGRVAPGGSRWVRAGRFLGRIREI